MRHPQRRILLFAALLVGGTFLMIPPSVEAAERAIFTSKQERANQPVTPVFLDDEVSTEEDMAGLTAEKWDIVFGWIDENIEIRKGWIWSVSLLGASILTSLAICYIISCTDFWNGTTDRAGYQPEPPSVLSDKISSLSKNSTLTNRSGL